MNPGPHPQAHTPLLARYGPRPERSQAAAAQTSREVSLRSQRLP